MPAGLGVGYVVKMRPETPIGGITDMQGAKIQTHERDVMRTVGLVLASSSILISPQITAVVADQGEDYTVTRLSKQTFVPFPFIPPSFSTLDELVTKRKDVSEDDAS